MVEGRNFDALSSIETQVSNFWQKKIVERYTGHKFASESDFADKIAEIFPDGADIRGFGNVDSETMRGSREVSFTLNAIVANDQRVEERMRFEITLIKDVMVGSSDQEDGIYVNSVKRIPFEPLRVEAA